jgi:hypothetical protein
VAPNGDCGWRAPDGALAALGAGLRGADANDAVRDASRDKSSRHKTSRDRTSRDT